MGDAMVRADSAALVMQSAHALDAAMRAASALKGARGLLPESLKTEGEVLAVILAGQELGLPTMASLRGLQVVRGKVIISYDTMIALLKSRGYRLEWPDRTATLARLRLTAPDGSEHTETWDVERAKRAGLWGQKGPWSQYPEAMLTARCVSSAARAFAAEVLAGCYVEGELPERAPSQPRRVEVTSASVKVEADRAPREMRLADVQTPEELHAWIASQRDALESLTGARRDRAVASIKDAAHRVGEDESAALWSAGLALWAEADEAEGEVSHGKT